ncbi:MAG: metallophosphoesterase [Clostridia bacterium]|nr:metallophosphoesterase [Clostridia bacterium]
MVTAWKGKGKDRSFLRLKMEILVISDSHGVVSHVRKAVREHPDAKALLFAGDGLSDLGFLSAEYPDLDVYKVWGNCDYARPADSAEERMLTLDGVRIFLLHGHQWGVKGGYETAAAYARRNGADVLVYGHTHTPLSEYLLDTPRPLLVFNPGSLGRPKDGKYHYGILTVQNGAVLPSIGEFDRE